MQICIMQPASTVACKLQCTLSSSFLPLWLLQQLLQTTSTRVQLTTCCLLEAEGLVPSKLLHMALLLSTFYTCI
jgi:hypothetical protein